MTSKRQKKSIGKALKYNRHRKKIHSYINLERVMFECNITLFKL